MSSDEELSASRAESAATLRRRIDSEMAETLREYRQRVIDTSERLTRIDESLIYLKSEYSHGRESRITIQEQQTIIAERLTGLSTRFIEHIEEATGERALLQALTTLCPHCGKQLAPAQYPEDQAAPRPNHITGAIDL